MGKKLTTVRCQSCKRVILEADIKDGIVRKKCDKCGTMNTLEIRPADQTKPYTERLGLRLK